MVEVKDYQELFNDGSEPLEDCEVCGRETSCWWADGCMPLCRSCAKYMDFDTTYRLAKDNEYGPLPRVVERDGKFVEIKVVNIV